jgi:hypothetical protein
MYTHPTYFYRSPVTTLDNPGKRYPKQKVDCNFVKRSAVHTHDYGTVSPLQDIIRKAISNIGDHILININAISSFYLTTDVRDRHAKDKKSSDYYFLK